MGRPNPLVHKGRGYQAAVSTLQESIPIPIAAVETLWMLFHTNGLNQVRAQPCSAHFASLAWT